MLMWLLSCLTHHQTNIKDRKTKRLRARSLFYSIKTQRAHWDEPPSGASNVVYLKQGHRLESSMGLESGRNTTTDEGVEDD